MGILNLAKLIADFAPNAVKENEFNSYFGRKIAIDASMAIYQFLIAIRHTSSLMTNDQGEATSHLVGLFYRTCKMLENGIKPIYVFDGKAPELKSGELEKRKERRKEAENKLKKAETEEEKNKFTKRLVRVTKQHNEDCKKLLKLLGCPIVTSPSEAEAQCAQLCKEDLVYAIATEDMDGLTFGAPRLIRNLSSGKSDQKTKEYNFNKILEGLELTYDQFIDLCILMGCDYCDSIKGIGGKKGLELIKKYGSIEEILKQKYNITEFIEPDISYIEKSEIKLESLETEKIMKEETEILTPKDINDKNDDSNEKPKVYLKNSLNQSIDNLSVKKEKKEENEEEKNIKEEDEEEENEEEKNIKEENEEEENEEEENIKEENDENDEKIHSNNSNNKKKKLDNNSKLVPDNWLFKGARKLFKEPNVLVNTIKESDLKFKDIDEEGLIKFLCKENGFNEDRIRPAINRVKTVKNKINQTRIDSFFKILPQDNSKSAKKQTCNKRPSTGKESTNKRGRKQK